MNPEILLVQSLLAVLALVLFTALYLKAPRKRVVKTAKRGNGRGKAVVEVETTALSLAKRQPKKSVGTGRQRRRMKPAQIPAWVMVEKAGQKTIHFAPGYTPTRDELAGILLQNGAKRADIAEIRGNVAYLKNPIPRKLALRLAPGRAFA